MSLAQNKPYSEQIELAVLGGLMSANEALDEVSSILNSDCFYSKKNQIIFEAISELAKKNISHDLIGVYEQIKSVDQKNKKEGAQEIPRVKQIGGIEYLYHITSEYDTYSNIKHHAQILARYRTLRKLIEVGNKINELGNNPAEQTTEELVNVAEHMIFEVGQENFNDSNIKSSAVSADDVRKSYNKAKKLKDGEYLGVETGFKEIDKMLLGLQAGGLYILAARPGIGKTSFALNIATNIAKQNRSVLFFSLEMTAEELMRRMVAGEAEVNTYDILLGKLKGKEFTKFSDAVSTLKALPIDADESAKLNPTEMLSRSRRIYKKRKLTNHSLGLIVVDYIQLMEVPWIKDNRVREVSEITRHLKILAKELQIPVLALSQLNREFDKQNTKKRAPRLSDLRDSGSIEQDADVVLFIDRDLNKNTEETQDDFRSSMSSALDSKNNINKDQTMSDPSKTNLYIAKNRHGRTGVVELYFAEKFTKFKNKEERPLYEAEYISDKSFGS